MCTAPVCNGVACRAHRGHLRASRVSLLGSVAGDNFSEAAGHRSCLKCNGVTCRAHRAHRRASRVSLLGSAAGGNFSETAGHGSCLKCNGVTCRAPWPLQGSRGSLLGSVSGGNLSEAAGQEALSPGMQGTLLAQAEAATSPRTQV
eukprot:1161319-Pelagomonas_calceolata.AAC.12